MEYGILVHWKFQMIAFYLLFGMSLMTAEQAGGGRVVRRLAAHVVPHVIGVVPVGLLMYSLYIVSYRL